MNYQKVWVDEHCRKTATEGMNLAQNSSDNELWLFSKTRYANVKVAFRLPTGSLHYDLHMAYLGYDDDQEAYKYALAIPYSVTNFTLPSATGKLSVSFHCWQLNDFSKGGEAVCDTAIIVNRSSNAEVYDPSYNGEDIESLWRLLGQTSAEITGGDLLIHVLSALPASTAGYEPDSVIAVLVDGDIAFYKNASSAWVKYTFKEMQTEIDANESAISAEATARQNADAVLQGNIDANSSAISAETLARQSADSALQNNIDTNSSAIAQEIIDRSSAVSAEALARENGDSTTLASAQSYADSKVASVYKPKGSVATYADLPSTPSTGDVYNVIAAYGNVPAGTNFVWNGTAWDALGGTVDLSGYVPTSRTVNGHALTADVTVTKADILGTYGGTQVTDLNAIVFSGFYTCLGTATGVPNSSSSWYVTHVNSNTGTADATQTAVSFGTMVVYYRVKTASTWGAWVQETYKTAFDNAGTSLDTIVIKGAKYKVIPCGSANGASALSGGATAISNGSHAVSYGEYSSALSADSISIGNAAYTIGIGGTSIGSAANAGGLYGVSVGFLSDARIAKWATFDGNTADGTNPINRYLSLYSPDFILFRNEDVSRSKYSASAYAYLKALTDYLGTGAPNVVTTETLAGIFAGTSANFDVSGTGTAGDPYIVTPKVNVNNPHARKIYQITATAPASDTYFRFKASGVERCMVRIISNLSTATYSYFLNFIDLYGHVRSRNKLNGGTLVSADINSKTGNAEIYLDVNSPEMYATQAI